MRKGIVQCLLALAAISALGAPALAELTPDYFVLGEIPAMPDQLALPEVMHQLVDSNYENLLLNNNLVPVDNAPADVADLGTYSTDNRMVAAVSPRQETQAPFSKNVQAPFQKDPNVQAPQVQSSKFASASSGCHLLPGRAARLQRRSDRAGALRASGVLNASSCSAGGSCNGSCSGPSRLISDQDYQGGSCNSGGGGGSCSGGSCSGGRRGLFRRG